MDQKPTNTDGIHYQLLTSKYLNDACEVIKNALFIPGSLNAALGIPNDPEALAELDQLSKATAKDGMSVIAIDKNKDKVAGVAFNKFWLKHENFLENFAQTLKNHKSQQILHMIVNTQKMCDLFELLQVDCVMEIFLLGTANEYRQQGIGEKLCRFSMDVAQRLYDGNNVKQPMDGRVLALEPVPEAVSAIFNSPVSQRIGRKLGLEVVAERSNSRIELKNEVVEIPGETSTTTLGCKKLSKK